MPPRDSSEMCPTWDPADTWLGQDADMDTEGCDVHCQPCPIGEGDALFSSTPLSVGGGRWVRPKEIESHDSLIQPSRDARGKFHHLKTGEAHLFPPIAAFERAQCYRPHNDQECFGLSSCACDPQLDVDYGSEWQPGMPDCREGVFAGSVRRTPVADINFFNDYSYANASASYMDCRREVIAEKGPLTKKLTEGRGSLYQAHLMRSNHGCQVGVMSTCIGEWHNNECTPGYPEPTSGFHNSHGSRTIWNRWFVNRLNVYLKPRGLETPVTQAILDAQNAALAWFNTSRSIEQVLKTTAGGGGNFGAGQINSDVFTWSQGWDATDFQPVYMTLPNCQLRFTGCPVTVDLVVRSARIQMSFVPLYITDDGVKSIVPSVRTRIRLELGARATMGDCVWDAPWDPDGETVPLTLGLNSVTDRFPSVIPPLDELVYRSSSGVPFTPPIEVEWWGSRQELTDSPGKWEDVWGDFNPIPEALQYSCCALAKRVSPLSVYGAPTMNKEVTRVQHYGGTLEFSLNLKLCEGTFGEDGGEPGPEPGPAPAPGEVPIVEEGPEPGIIV